MALEAFAAGIPVISTDVGGLPEVNLHGRTGMLRPVGDVEGMAEDALHVLDSANFPQFQRLHWTGPRRSTSTRSCPNTKPCTAGP